MNEIVRKELKNQVRNQLLGAVVGALGLVVGLAWNDAIKSLIEFLYPLDKTGVGPKFLYAVLLTVLVVIITYTLMAWFKKDESTQ